MNKMKIINAIKKSKAVLIISHMNPDLDALCSQLAVALYCKNQGKKVLLVNHCKVPARYKFIPGMAQIKKVTPRMKADYDLAIILDCGELKRIGRASNLIHGAITINIDHHISNDQFADINHIDPHSSSTSEIVYDLLKKAKFSLTKNLAIYLYIGILTDTGSFRYSNTTAKTHQIISALMQFDFEPDKIYRKIYESIPFEDFSLFAKIVGNFKELHEKRVVYFEFDKKTQKQFSEDFDLRETILNFLRLAKGIELVIIFSIIDPIRTRVNFRSTGKINVSKLAQKFQGGGHKRASGCMIDQSISGSKKLILREVQNLFK